MTMAELWLFRGQKPKETTGNGLMKGRMDSFEQQVL